MRVSVWQGVLPPHSRASPATSPGFDTSPVWHCAKLLILSEPQCIHLQNGSDLTELSGELSEKNLCKGAYVKHW